MAEKKLGLDETLKATVVSILPMKLYEHKPGVFCTTLPARIPKANFDKKEIVTYHLADGIRYQYVPGFPEGDARETVRHTIPALQIATAICDDYIQAKMGFSMADENDDILPIPGLIPFDGVYTSDEVKVKFPDKIEKLFAQQIKWFTRLVKMADDEWQRTRTYKMITDEQVLAARCLKLERDWSIDASKAGFIKCFVCKSSIDSEAIVCSYCRAVVKPEAYKKIQFVDVNNPVKSV